MDIPVNVEVRCADGLAGRTSCVIINPVTEQVTHIVVQEKGFPYLKRIVPLDLITETSPQLIHLRCTIKQLATLKPFLEIEYTQDDRPYFNYEAGEYRLWPYATTDPLLVPVELEQIPPGELGIHPGAQVKATDGHAGRVNEFLVDPASGHITHLILREGRLWGKKDITIPVSAIDRIDEDEVFLKLDRRSIEKLPAIPVRRRYEKGPRSV